MNVYTCVIKNVFYVSPHIQLLGHLTFFWISGSPSDIISLQSEELLLVILVEQVCWRQIISALLLPKKKKKKCFLFL